MKKITKRLLSLFMAVTVTASGLFIPESKPVLAASTKISSAGDLKKLEEDPYGDYQLTKDITVPKNTSLCSEGSPFMGVLDGKGHKIKGYKSTESQALFVHAKNALFKNLSMTNVDINVKDGAAGLVYHAEGCEFVGVKVSGKIVSGGDGGYAGGIAGYGSGSMEKCSNSAKITAKTKKGGKTVGGLAGGFEAASLKNCTNSGSVTLSTGTHKYLLSHGEHDGTGAVFTAAGLIGETAEVVSSCKNSGNVTINLNYGIDKKSDEQILSSEGLTMQAVGVCTDVSNSISSTGNTGKIKVVSKQSAPLCGESRIAGVTGLVWLIAKEKRCYNTGSISFSGKCEYNEIEEAPNISIGGVFASCSTPLKESYNTGNINVSLFKGHKGRIDIGGLAGSSYKISNCYNTGNITVKNKGRKKDAVIGIGGLAAASSLYQKDKATCNYSTGKVTFCSDSTINKKNQGVLIGHHDGVNMFGKRCSDNYYTASGTPYGSSDSSWKPYQGTAKKVSSITSGSCPKLSSKYWTYSSKHKRLILKNNKEK